MYIGIVVSKHAIWMPPMATKTSLLPSASSQRLKNNEKTSPCNYDDKIVSVRVQDTCHGSMLTIFLLKFNVTSASPAYWR